MAQRIYGLALAALVAAAPAVAAQGRGTAAQPTTIGTDAVTLASGWQAFSAANWDAAAQAAAKILSRTPWHHAALTLRIEALAQKDPLQSLDAYEAWLGNRTTEDAGLLEPVARAVLVRLAASSEADVRSESRRLLRDAGFFIAGGDAADPMDQLAEAARGARTGDAAAIRRLEGLVNASSVDPDVLARSLEDAGDAATPLLMGMLEKPAGPARAAAAAALGRRKVEQARSALQKRMQDPDPTVRTSAVVALARMGDPAAQAEVDRMLQSEVPDLRLVAAEAWDGQPGPWVTAIMPLLDNRDGTTRLVAARLLAPVDPAAAQRVLAEAAGDKNPVIRAEAARVTQEVAARLPEAANLPQARRLLREKDAFVRLQAAGVVLNAARAGR